MNITVVDIKNGIHSQIVYLREMGVAAVNAGRTKEAIGYLQHINELEKLDAIFQYGSSKYDTIIDGECFASLVRQHVNGANFFVYDNDGGMTDHTSADEARKEAEKRLEGFREVNNECGEWGDVKSLCWGIIFGRATESVQSCGDTYEEYVVHEMAEM